MRLRERLKALTASRRAWRNLAALAGIALIAIGLWWLSPAWCFVLIGLAIVTGAILGMWFDRPEKPEKTP